MLKILKSRIINALNCGPERTQLGAEYYLQVIICQAGKLAANAVDTVVGWKTWPTLSNLGNYPSPASHLAPLSLSLSLWRSPARKSLNAIYHRRCAHI